MTHLAIILLGGFQVKLDGQSLNGFRTDKNRALLAYLALESRRPHSREALAALLWPNRPETQAHDSLRQALYQLHKIIPQAPQTQPHLLITPDHVQFNLTSDHWIDVVQFRSWLSACYAHHPADSDLCSSCLDSLQCAIELYQGEFLAGFSLTDVN